MAMLTPQWFWIRTSILGLCWGLFCTVWLIGAIYNAFQAPTVQKRSGPLYPWLAGIATFAIAKWLYPQHFWALLTFDTPWTRVIGTICLLLATAFTLWARWVLGTMWSSSAVARVGHQLRTDGPYQLSRHPIYTGMLGMLFGMMLMNGFGFYTLIFLLGIVFLEIKLHQEEGLLRQTFGDEYLHYQQRVPQLIPGLKRRKGERKGA